MFPGKLFSNFISCLHLDLCKPDMSQQRSAFLTIHQGSTQNKTKQTKKIGRTDQNT